MPNPVGSLTQRLLPNIANSETNVIRELWDRLHTKPGGRILFSRAVGMAAPYTSTIGARVEELHVGYSKVTLRDRKAVRNHLRSVHAVALANLAELTGNLAVAYSLPDDARFIVAGMNLEYLKKARGLITGSCECPSIETSAREEYTVEVSLRDSAGEEVVHSTLRTLVGPKKQN